MAGTPLSSSSGAVSASGVTSYLRLDTAPVDVDLGSAQSVVFLKPLNTRLIFVAGQKQNTNEWEETSLTEKEGYAKQEYPCGFTRHSCLATIGANV